MPVYINNNNKKNEKKNWEKIIKNDMLPEKMNNTKKINCTSPNATASRPMATL